MNPFKVAALSTSVLCCPQIFATPMIISDYEADKRYVAFSMSPISQDLEVSDGTDSGNDSRDLMAVNLSFSNVQDSLGSVTLFMALILQALVPDIALAKSSLAGAQGYSFPWKMS